MCSNRTPARCTVPAPGMWKTTRPTRAATCALLQRWGCQVPLPAAPRSAGRGTRQCPQLVLLDVPGPFYGPDVYTQLCERWGSAPPSSCSPPSATPPAPPGRRARLGLSGQAGPAAGAAGADEPDLWSGRESPEPAGQTAGRTHRAGCQLQRSAS
jgi:hypothetical protein